MRNIPVIHVRAKNLPEAWEKAVTSTWEKGIQVKTEYDRKDDPPSKDCSMIIEVLDPLSEPRIHRAMPAGLGDLEIYKQEVLNGVHDNRIGKQGYPYTYHDRLYRFISSTGQVNQINFITNKLSEAPYSRRAQAITWNVDLDLDVSDPPCLQRVWCRIIKDAEDKLVLNMNTHWRSRDGYKAAFMNMFVMIELQRVIAKRIGKSIGQTIEVGRYVDISDSFHIYGSDYDQFRGFLVSLISRSFENRTYTSDYAEPFFKEAKDDLRKELNTLSLFKALFSPNFDE